MSDPFAHLPVTRKPKRQGIFSDVSGGSSSGESDPFASLPVTKKRKPNKLGFLAPVASGLTMGASDEILGGIEGLSNIGEEGGFSAGYQRGKDKVRQVGKDFASENPKTSIALELAGGLAAPGFGAAGLISRGATTGAKIGRGAIAGSGLGAAGGALYSEEGNRTGGAVAGGVLGGIAGAGIPAIGAGAGKVANVLGMRTEKGARKLATGKVAEAFARDEVSPDAIRQAGDEAAASGTPARLFDLGKQNVLGLARAAQAVPGKARTELADVLHGRQQGQAGRIFGKVEEAAGVKGRDLSEVLGEINKRASDKASPFYEKARNAPPIDSPALDALLKRPSMRRAIEEGVRRAADQGKSLPRIYRTVLKRSGEAAKGGHHGSPKTPGRPSLVDPSGNPVMVKVTERVGVPSLEMLDYAKQSLDDRISALLRAGKKGKARDLQILRKEMLDVVDEAVPDYKQARRLFAGEKAHETAVLRGSRVFGKPKVNEPPIDKWLAKATPGEVESFKVGALGRIRDILESTADNRDKVQKLTGTPKARRVLQEIIGDQGKNTELGKILAGESKLVQSKNFILGNSQTARILADMDDMTNDALGALMDIGTGNFAGAGKKMLGAGLRGRAKAGGGKIAEGVNRNLMLEPGTPEFDALMEAMVGRQTQKPFQMPVDRLMSRLLP